MLTSSTAVKWIKKGDGKKRGKEGKKEGREEGKGKSTSLGEKLSGQTDSVIGAWLILIKSILICYIINNNLIKNPKYSIVSFLF